MLAMPLAASTTRRRTRPLTSSSSSSQTGHSAARPFTSTLALVLGYWNPEFWSFLATFEYPYQRSVLHATEKKVYITVNGVRSEISMKLGKSGEAFFVKSFGANEEPTNPLSPNGTPPSSPLTSLKRQNR